MTGRGWISALRGTLLGSVLRAGLLTVGDAGRVERGADHLVAEARQVLDAAAAYEHHGVLLQVVALARDVGADLEPVRQANAGDLTKRRVRLLRGGRRDARADAALLRGSRERRGLGLRGLARTALANQLIDGRHCETGSPRTGRMQTEGRGSPEAPTDRGMVAKRLGCCKRPLKLQELVDCQRGGGRPFAPQDRAACPGA